MSPPVSKSVTSGMPLDVGSVAVVGVWKTGVPDAISFVNTRDTSSFAPVIFPVRSMP